MSIEIIPKGKQAQGAFDGGAILENKPIGFPQDGSYLKPQGALFYWANAWSDKDGKGGLIDLHPHQGFEIFSVLIEGEFEHYDTKLKEWIPLKTGDIQIIRSGSGISHAEKALPGGRMFQIWLDPGLQKTLQKPASYNDYRFTEFPKEELDGVSLNWAMGEKGPIHLDTPALSFWAQGKGSDFALPLKDTNTDREFESTAGTYVISGSGSVNGQKVKEHDFILTKAEEELVVSGASSWKSFTVCVPKDSPYPLYPASLGR